MLSAWKATQYRSFLLYIGPIVLRNVLPDHFLEHFQLLTVCMRLLSRRLPHTHTAERWEVLQKRGNQANVWLRAFVKRGMQLYTDNFCVYNVHNLIHCAADYIRFGPIHSYSCFRYENCIGRIKRLVTGHCKPAMQVINKYSSLLFFKEYGKEGNRSTNFSEEYFQVPHVFSQIIDEDHTGKPTELNEKYKSFEKMRFRNFIIRSDRIGDSFCVVN